MSTPQGVNSHVNSHGSGMSGNGIEYNQSNMNGSGSVDMSLSSPRVSAAAGGVYGGVQGRQNSLVMNNGGFQSVADEEEEED